MPRSRITQAPNDWSPEGQRLEVILMEQGRQTDWLPDQLGISRNYLYRMRLNPTNPMYRPPQPGLWAKIERILGKPPGSIAARTRSLGTRDRVVVEDRLRTRRQVHEPVAATA